MTNQIQKTLMESLKAFYQQALSSGKFKTSLGEITWSEGEVEHQTSVIQPTLGVDTSREEVNVLIETPSGFIKSFNIKKITSLNILNMDEQAGVQFSVVSTDGQEVAVVMTMTVWDVCEEPFKTAMIVQLPEDVEYDQPEDYLDHEKVFDLVPNEQGRVIYLDGSKTKLRFDGAEWAIDPNGKHVVTLASDDESVQLNLERL